MMRLHVVYAAIVSCFLAACVSTTLDVPADHPASPRYPSAPIARTTPLIAESAPVASPPPAPDHSHHHQHGGTP